MGGVRAPPACRNTAVCRSRSQERELSGVCEARMRAGVVVRVGNPLPSGDDWPAVHRPPSVRDQIGTLCLGCALGAVCATSLISGNLPVHVRHRRRMRSTRLSPTKGDGARWLRLNRGSALGAARAFRWDVARWSTIWYTTLGTTYRTPRTSKSGIHVFLARLRHANVSSPRRHSRSRAPRTFPPERCARVCTHHITRVGQRADACAE